MRAKTFQVLASEGRTKMVLQRIGWKPMPLHGPQFYMDPALKSLKKVRMRLPSTGAFRLGFGLLLGWMFTLWQNLGI